MPVRARLAALNHLAALSVAAAMSAPAAVPAAACGLEGAGLIGLAVQRTLITWRYPETSRLPTAVVSATRLGLLKSRPERSGDPLAFHRTQALLQQFAAAVRGQDRSSVGGYNVLLLAAMLWTKVAPASQGGQATVHAAGPAPDRPLVVTEPPVIVALLAARLGADEAEQSGLLGIYGPPDQVERLRMDLRHRFSKRPDSVEPQG